MGFKFTVNASDLNRAIDVVSLVEPQAFNKQDHAGYLVVIRGATGYLYSRNSLHAARAGFPVSNVEGEGAFIYPKASVGAFKVFAGSEITFSVESGETYSVSYVTSSNAKAEKPSYDPKFGQTCDKEFNEATVKCSFPPKILQEALSLSSGFYAEANDKRSDDKVKSVVIFDSDLEADDPKNAGTKIKPYERANGFLQADNGSQLFSFYSDAFEGRSLSIHAQHIGKLNSFLSSCVGDVKIRVSGNMTFAEDAEGRVFGWVHHSVPTPKHKNLPFSADHIVLDVDRDLMLNALGFIREEIETNREKIKFLLTPEGNVSFQIVEGTNKATSWPVGVKFTSDTKDRREVQMNVSLVRFRALFEKTRGNVVQLRIAIMPPADGKPKETAMFRTVDEYLLDANGKVVGGSGVEKRPEGSFLCRVMRYTSSMV